MAKKDLMKKPKQGGLPLWIGTFGDLMSLLLTFFILLLSMATFDKEKVELAIGSLQGALSILERGIETEITKPSEIQASPIQVQHNTDNVMNLLSGLITEYNEMIKTADGPSIILEESQDGFLLRIPDDLLFDTGGSAIKNKEGILFLQRLSMKINEYKDVLQLKIVGNTDNVAYTKGSRIDNWDLSINRALSVANALSNFGVPMEIIQTGGEGEFNPIDTNETIEGRANNRRVDIYLREMELKSGKLQEMDSANGIINSLEEMKKNK